MTAIVVISGNGCQSFIKRFRGTCKVDESIHNLLVHNLIHKIFLDIYLSQIKDDCVCAYVRVRILAPKMTSLIKQIG